MATASALPWPGMPSTSLRPGGFRVAYAAALMRPSHGSRNLLGRCGFRPVSGRIPLRDSPKDDCVLCSSAPCSCRVVLLAADLG